MKAAGPRAASNAAGAVQFTSTGYGVEPCSRCRGRLLPGQLLGVVPGEWRTFHAECPTGCCTSCDGTGLDGSAPETGGKCWDCLGTGHPHDGPCLPLRCSICGEPHADGTCLL